MMAPDVKAAHEKVHGIERCPNCGDELTTATYHAHAQSGCLLGLITGVIEGRGEMTDEQLRRLVVDCDASAIWDAFNKHVMEPFEAGDFSA